MDGGMWSGYAAEIARQTSPVSSVRQSERACRSQVSATAGVVKCKALREPPKSSIPF